MIFEFMTMIPVQTQRNRDDNVKTENTSNKTVKQ